MDITQICKQREEKQNEEMKVRLDKSRQTSFEF